MSTPPATPRQAPPAVSPPTDRRYLIAVAVVLVVGGALLPVAPELTIALICLVAIYGLFVLARYAAFWLKHRPISRQYDSKGRPQPHKTEAFLLLSFALWPIWFRLALDIPIWLCAVLAVPLYFLGKLALFRWWIPRRERPATS